MELTTDVLHLERAKGFLWPVQFHSYLTDSNNYLAKHKDLSPDSPIHSHLDILIFSFMSRHLPSLCAMDEAFVLCLLHMSFFRF